MHQVRRNMSRRQSHKVFQLADCDDDRDADGETFNDRLRYQGDEPSGANQPRQHKDNPRQQRREEKPVKPKPRDNVCDDDDECPRRPTDLDLAPA